MRTGSWISKSEAETLELARRFAAELAPGDNVLLIGDLGAGKTTFTRGVVAYFDSSVQVTSPTFTLVQVYPTKPVISHIDLYRINDDTDLADLGLEEFFDTDAIVIVEWAEKCAARQPLRFYRVTLSLRSLTERDILIEDFTDVAGAG
jgi:tRNA threonylcarbamoyl adenosine modification protein YjeE